MYILINNRLFYLNNTYSCSISAFRSDKFTCTHFHFEAVFICIILLEAFLFQVIIVRNKY